MKCHRFSIIASVGLALTACIPPNTPAPPPTGTTAIVPSPTPIPVFTPTLVPPPTATTAPAPSPTPIPSPTSGPQLIAYLRGGHLLVTDVTGGVMGATLEYTYPGVGDFATEVTWSPNGSRLAFTGYINNQAHLIYVSPQNVGGGLIDDLGPGDRPAWAPDNTTLAYVGGGYPDENIWTINVETRELKQLTFQTNYAWGNPAFTPDGQALIVTGADRNNMGAQGNTSFTLERLALDGTGTRTPLPGATAFEAGRLPYDLRFSPDGTRLAFSSSFHLSACASPGAYYVSAADGANRQELISPGLQAAIDPGKEYYHVGLSYAWSPTNDALAVFGNVVNCDFNSPDVGESVAGPQLSILGLDGNERLVIPGTFYGISFDRTGVLLGLAHYQDNQDTAPVVELYSTQTGQLMLGLGPGSNPHFQP